MPNKGLVTALAVGFLAVALWVLPAIRTAHAEQCVTRGTPPFCEPGCEAGEYEKARITGGGCVGTGLKSSYQTVCCKLGDVNKGHTTTAPVNPCEGLGPNYDYDKTGKCTKRMKRMGKEYKGQKDKSALRNACISQGLSWNEQTGRCRKMKQMGKEYTGQKDKSALRRACDLQNWVWNEKTGRCKKPTQAKADCEARGSNYRYDLDTGGCVGGMSKGKRKRVDMSGDDADREFDDEDFQPEKKKRKRKRHLEVDIDDLF